MDHNDFMRLAITMAAKCKPEDPIKTPKVGAVVAIAQTAVALASRGKDEHAEKIALDEAVDRGIDLRIADVYTTLEPCVASVRSKHLDSCADRLVAAKVRKVVIGIHDPNISVCGKGFLRLQEGGIETELFPKNLAEEIKQLNREFILGQQRIGLKITHPNNNEALPREPNGGLTIKGKWINPPRAGDQLWAVLHIGGRWWPQREIQPIPDSDGEWQVHVGISVIGVHTVHVGRINPLGMVLFDYYNEIVNVHREWERILAEGPNPKNLPGRPWVGIKVQDSQIPKGH